jgi:PII-like signaling protein
VVATVGGVVIYSGITGVDGIATVYATNIVNFVKDSEIIISITDGENRYYSKTVNHIAIAACEEKVTIDIEKRFTTTI